VISATDQFGGPIYVIVNCLEIPKLVGPLLCCAATNSRASLPEPQQHTAITGSHLPVLCWQIGRTTVEGEPVLILTLAGGATLAFQFHPQAARQCGKALEQAGVGTGSDIPAEVY
jgi:hypothetical protein